MTLFSPIFIASGRDLAKAIIAVGFPKNCNASWVITEGCKAYYAERKRLLEDFVTFDDNLPRLNEIWGLARDLAGLTGAETISLSNVEIMVQTYLLVLAEVCKFDLDEIMGEQDV